MFLHVASWGLIGLSEEIESDNSASYLETPLNKYDRQHWSFLPIAKPDVPSCTAPCWCRNEVDCFVATKLAENGLSTQPTASRRTLIRRLSYDLTGLPPSPEQIEAFLEDSSDDAYSRLVDRLLDSTRYGERWAQHWLDLARFSETDGFEHDKVRKEAWKYRDWVIRSLNDDMPYDEFIRLQLAGDEIYPNDEEALTATRFCLSGPDMPDINLLEERRHSVLNELTSTVGEVLLGLQVGCAQCHDHKYDPISQADFYRLRAVFEPALTLKKNRSLSTLQEVFPYSRDSHLMLRGDFRSPGPVVQPVVVRVVATDANTFSPKAAESSAGLRTALANWLTSPENPLTSRVIVNRVWQHHFGEGLVDTPSDFGLMGYEPSHAKLLDWLAASLIEHDWNLKWLHRTIVDSATYRQRSRLPEAPTQSEITAWELALNADPDCELLSRYPRWRLEGEAIRDAILSSAGQINLKSGGPGVRPPLPKELVKTLLKNQWVETEDEAEHYRRSIYVFARRNLRYPIFEVFDRPSANTSCSIRGVSTTAPQSLHLLNSRFTLNMSQHMAESLLTSHSSLDSQIDGAFLRTLGRIPEADERAMVHHFVHASGSTPHTQLTHLCLALFNCNEFVIVD
ncbi:MAG TPA: hypothetical protein DDW52_08155 [Planctomycetaceae bacterium]|nr:hypothetical protein [Planctomycetaceae bacterium]